MGDADTADMNPYFWGPCLASKGSQQANKIYRLLADSEDLGGELSREGGLREWSKIFIYFGGC